MPVHDWKRVPAGIFHDFHNAWIFAIKTTLNDDVLPEGYYSLSEQYAGAFGPDVLTLQTVGSHDQVSSAPPRNGRSPLLAKPRSKPIASTEMDFYRSKQKTVTVRHVSDDEVVAIVEIVSAGNKSNTRRFNEFIDKAAWLLDQRIHLAIVDLFPPTRRDPEGIHGEVWEDISGEPYAIPRGKKNRTRVSYECGIHVQAYVDHFAVGDKLADMPLFLEPGGCVEVPLEATYRKAFNAVPKRWRDELTGK